MEIWWKFLFIGTLPPGQLARLLSLSDLHIYLVEQPKVSPDISYARGVDANPKRKRVNDTSPKRKRRQLVTRSSLTLRVSMAP